MSIADSNSKSSRMQTAELKRKVAALESEAGRCAEERDRLNEQASRLRSEIAELRRERDELNEKVKALKRERSEEQQRLKALRDELEASRKTLAELVRKAPRKSAEELERALEQTEWVIQTSSFSVQEEKRLIEQVKLLETQVKIHRKLAMQRESLRRLENAAVQAAEKRDEAHRQLVELASKSQELHGKLVSKAEELKKLKAQADAQHQAFIQAREKAAPLNAALRQLQMQEKAQVIAARREAEKALAARRKALKEQLELEARKKLERGEPLTLDEFKLLGGDDAEAQD